MFNLNKFIAHNVIKRHRSMFLDDIESNKDKLLEKIPYEELKPQMCEQLFERDYSTVSEKIAEYKKENGNKKII